MKGDWANYQRRGEQNGSARLTEDDVRLIREGLADRVPISVIARVHGVSRTAIYHIKSGRNWGHV